MSRIVLRLLVVAVASLLTVLAVEGGLSLFLGRSLRPRPFVDLARLMSRGAGIGMATGSTEQFRVHPDPRVGVVLQPGSGFKILESTYSADTLGVRGRPGPPPQENALRIAVVGDSVAFGAGVNDDEVLAVQLERLLRAEPGSNARPIACYTVAASGWNHRNAVNFLIDHFDHYRPDIVIYIPVENDLTDSYGVFESGSRRVGGDVMAAEPLLTVNDEPRYLFQYHLAQHIRDHGLDAIRADQIGIAAITADLSPESRRRYEENAGSILRLDRVLAQNGGRLALLFYSEYASNCGHTWLLRERLLERGATVPEIPGLTSLDPSVTLPNDAHPNPTGHRGLAVWIAEWLVAQGWVDGTHVPPLPPPPATMAALRAPPRTAADVRDHARTLREGTRRRLQARLDLNSGQGVQQILGGVNPDGTLGTRFLALLGVTGTALRVRAAPLDPPPPAPVRVKVAVDGTPVGELTLSPGDGEVEQSFSLPAAGRAAGMVEVELTPDDWFARMVIQRWGVASFRLLWLDASG